MESFIEMRRRVPAPICTHAVSNAQNLCLVLKSIISVFPLDELVEIVRFDTVQKSFGYGSTGIEHSSHRFWWGPPCSSVSFLGQMVVSYSH